MNEKINERNQLQVFLAEKKPHRDIRGVASPGSSWGKGSIALKQDGQWIVRWAAAVFGGESFGTHHYEREIPVSAELIEDLRGSALQYWRDGDPKKGDYGSYGSL